MAAMAQFEAGQAAAEIVDESAGPAVVPWLSDVLCAVSCIKVQTYFLVGILDVNWHLSPAPQSQ
jgi:hypothetical protein